MKRKIATGKFLVGFLVSFLIISCGGGTDGIEGTGLKGTVATGSPVSDSIVTIKGNNGKTVNTRTNQQGKYEVDVSILTAPYLIKVDVGNNRNLFSIATQAGIANAHPISDLLVRNWLALQAQNIETLFDSDVIDITPTAVEKLEELQLAYIDLFKKMLDTYEVAESFNLITSEFDADSTGFDRLLDLTNVNIANSTFDIVFVEPQSSVQYNFFSNYQINIDFSLPDSQKPLPPNNVNVFSIGDQQVLLTWNVSDDNYAVTDYNIYRNGELINTSPYPIYTDAELIAETEYCYQIEAIDAANNISEKSIEKCATTTSFIDITAPSIPENFQVALLNEQRALLTWTPSQDNDVLGYHITRRSTNASSSRIATVITNEFLDANLLINSEYCYSIQAFDAKGNISSSSDEKCTTILANSPKDTTAPTTFSNPGGFTFTESTEVTLTCNDGNGVGCAGIHYTVDGSEPTMLSTLYTAPIVLTTTTTLQYFGVDSAENVELTIHSEIYTLGNNGNDNINKVEFSSANYSVAENSGAAEVFVVRFGDSSQAASVNYEVVDGSATTPEDYIPISGTIVWNENESTSKAIYIPIKGDTKDEGSETFNINLSSPSDSVVLGDIQSSSVTIENTLCNALLTEDIVVDTVLSDKCIFVENKISVKDGANLSILPGTSLIFGASAGFNVRKDGSLTANGTIANPILMTGLSMTPGYWAGVQFTFSNDIRNSLDHVTIEYAGVPQNGSANLIAFGSESLPNRLSIKNSRLVNGSGFGFEFSAGTVLSDFQNNIFRSNVLGAGKLDGNSIQYLDSDSDYSGNEADFVELLGTTDLTISQRWAAINVPYLVKTLNIKSDLELSPGNILMFEDDGRINVRNDGSLNAVGTSDKKIVFTSKSETPGAWGGIQFTFSNDNKNILDHVIVEYGGKRQNGSANVITFGSNGNPQRLKMTNSLLRFSSSNGFEFSEGLNLVEFANNIIVDNESYVGEVDINVIPALDVESDYSGNTIPFINVTGSDIEKDQSWNKLNVDYLADKISVKSNWIINPGVNIIFQNGGFVDVRESGSLNAEGLSEEPIMFSCEEQFRGAWRGIQFTFSNSGNNKLINTIVEYAGGAGGNGEGSIRLYGSNSLVSRAEIRDTLVQTGDSYAIWLDSGANTNADIETVNSFIDNTFDTVFRN